MIVQAVRVRAVHAEPTRDRRTRLPELLGFRLTGVPHVTLLRKGTAPAHVVDADLGRLGHVDLLRRLGRVSIDTAFSCARRAVLAHRDLLLLAPRHGYSAARLLKFVVLLL